jgi:hypothetical protein
VTWLSGSTEWMTTEATFIAGFWSTELKIFAIDAQGRFRNHYYHQHNKTMRIYIIFEWVGCSIFNFKMSPKYVVFLMTHLSSEKKDPKKDIRTSINVIGPLDETGCNRPKVKKSKILRRITESAVRSITKSSTFTTC